MTSVKVDSGSGGGGSAAAFVAKTYRMVDERGTDTVVSWGREGNSFVVLDPFVFSQTLLPAHFKHNNFSSFVRQLNTYGFRKVDPDRWEFAHASFLRGQTHLLRHIVRRGSAKRKDGIANTGDAVTVDDNEITMVATEVVRLKREQRAIDDKVAAMWRRVQEIERKPKQMVAFLLKVVGDRQRLNRLVGSSGGDSGNVADDVFPGEPVEGGEKRPRLLTEDCSRNADAFGPTAVDFAGFYAGGDMFGDVGVEVGTSGDGVGASFAFPVDSGYEY